MAATASDLFMNWDNVQVVYDVAGTPTTLDIGEVTNIELDEDIKQQVFYGDNRMRPKLIRDTEETNTIKIVGGNVAKLMEIPKGVPVTVKATLCDALNGTGVGALNVVLVNAMRGKITNKGDNNKFATADVGFMAYGNDDDSSPLTITPVTA